MRLFPGGHRFDTSIGFAARRPFQHEAIDARSIP